VSVSGYVGEARLVGKGTGGGFNSPVVDGPGAGPSGVGRRRAVKRQTRGNTAGWVRGMGERAGRGRRRQSRRNKGRKAGARGGITAWWRVKRGQQRQGRSGRGADEGGERRGKRKKSGRRRAARDGRRCCGQAGKSEERRQQPAVKTPGESIKGEDGRRQKGQGGKDQKPVARRGQPDGGKHLRGAAAAVGGGERAPRIGVTECAKGACPGPKPGEMVGQKARNGHVEVNRGGERRRGTHARQWDRGKESKSEHEPQQQRKKPTMG